jgi:protein involved in polysaccharide export with SLBB domain
VPGDYQYTDNMTLKDLVFNAGGLTEAASESTIELARRRNHAESNDLSEQIVKLFHFSIDRALSIENKADTFHLMPFDYVYVRKAPSYHEQRTVYIRGEVKYPGAYSIGSKNDRISDLLKRAGGVTPEAFVKGARMNRNNPAANIIGKTLQNNVGDTLLNRAKQQITNNQIEIKLEKILKNPGSEYDYFLKEGDEITIPEISEAVWIAGEVQNPFGMTFENGKSLKYYIDRSGGFSSNAKKSKTFIIYSDGTTKVSRNFIWHNYPPVEPGAQIIVPSKPEIKRPDNTGKWLAIASTITTILVAISRL